MMKEIRVVLPLFAIVGILLILTIGLYQWCYSLNEGSMVFSDVTKSTTQVMRPGMPILAPSGFSMQLRGNIDGTATLTLPDGSIEQISGPVATDFGGEWYEATAELKYDPETVKSGQLTLEYFFF